MRIRTRLILNAILLFLLVTLLFAFNLYTSRQIAGDLKINETASLLAERTTELVLLTNDYLRTRNERSQEQWQYKLDEINGLLAHHDQADKFIQAIPLLALLDAYFQKIKLEHKLEQQLTEQKASILEMDKIRLSEKMLSQQLQVNSQDILRIMFTISDEANRGIQKIQLRTNTTNIVFQIILLLVVLVNSIAIIRRIGFPIFRLVDEVKNIEFKKYSFSLNKRDHQKSDEHNDEIDELTSAFREMGNRLNEAFSALHTEISERKQAEEKLIKNQYYLTKAQEIGIIGTWELDIQKNILSWTEENYKIFGVPLGTEMNYELFLNCIHPDDREYVNEKWSAGLKHEPYDIEHRLVVDGNVKWVREKADIEFDEAGSPIMAIGFTQDITISKQAEEKITASLTEKVTLLHEIHHRVKNNMQVINSLLKLQANNLQDDRVKNVLKDSQSRVYAMSAVHETLHGSEKLSEIDLKNYLSKITTSIFQTYSSNQGKVKLNSDIENSPISLDQAYPLGLVINELLSNSLKHAFPEDRTGEISVNLKKTDSEFELIVLDDGVGIPDELDWKNSKSLGLKLVRNLVENQLDGSVDMENKGGTKFTIKFSIDNA